MEHSRNGARGEIAWNSGQARATLWQSTTRVCDACRRFQSRRHKVSGAGFIIPGEYRARADAYRMRDNDERRARYEAAEAERRASAAAFAAESERLRARIEAADARYRAALAAERKCNVI